MKMNLVTFCNNSIVCFKKSPSILLSHNPILSNNSPVLKTSKNSISFFEIFSNTKFLYSIIE